MAYDPRMQIDMTPDGRFRSPPRRPGLTWTTQFVIGAVLLAVVAGGLALAAALLWVVITLIPIAIVAGAVAYLAFRFKLWQARRRNSLGRERAVVRWP
jgi:hypothetical protein